MVAISNNALQKVPLKFEIKCKGGVYLLVTFGCFFLAWKVT